MKGTNHSVGQPDKIYRYKSIPEMIWIVLTVTISLVSQTKRDHHVALLEFQQIFPLAPQSQVLTMTQHAGVLFRPTWQATCAKYWTLEVLTRHLS